jgi:L-asparagine transporter-like permease
MAFFVFVLVLLTLEADTREALMVTAVVCAAGRGLAVCRQSVWRKKNLREILTLLATVRHKKGHPGGQ